MPSKGIKRITEETFEQVIEYFKRSLVVDLQGVTFIDPYGMVGLQKYFFQKIQKNVVEIAVMDTGVGFKNSLSLRFSFKDDLTAIEKALLHGASRYTDEGRGHGLAALRRFAKEWKGKLSIRSGTAKASIIPEWAWGNKKEVNLAHFPGAQINMLLPEI